MMTQKQFQPLIHAEVYNEAWFEMVFQAMDRLHDMASNGCLDATLRTDPAEMVGWLEDIIYTAQETIFELRTQIPGCDLTDKELFS